MVPSDQNNQVVTLILSNLPLVPPSADSVPPTEHSALIALHFVLQCRGSAVDFEQLEASARIGGSFGIPEMLSAAEAHGYYAWQHNCAWEDLVAVPFPALAELREGRFMVLGAFAQDRVLLQDPARTAHAAVLGRDEFLARWSGRLVLVTTFGSLPRCP